MNKSSIYYLIISAIILMLTGCSDQHKPLHGIYYGYYSNGDPQAFLILAFDKDHPNQVGFRESIDNLKRDSVFKVSYEQHSLMLHTPGKNIKLLISKDNRILTCLSCNGINGPKTFSDTDNSGKPYPAKIGDIAYRTISKNAKERGTYLPRQIK